MQLRRAPFGGLSLSFPSAGTHRLVTSRGSGLLARAQLVASVWDYVETVVQDLTSDQSRFGNDLKSAAPAAQHRFFHRVAETGFKCIILALNISKTFHLAALAAIMYMGSTVRQNDMLRLT